jgi:UDPglucose--hexose-1-phosphate uridylyltransferase
MIRQVADPSGRWPWLARVVPNRFPALAVEAGTHGFSDGLFPSRDGLGAHEVLIETPDHDGPPLGIAGPDVSRTLRLWFDRIADLQGDRRLRAFIPWKNQGLLAGATLHHPHAQLLALPYLPPALAQCLDRSHEHHREHRRCLLCDLLDEEVALGGRVVHADTDVVVLCPFASRSSWELLIAPRRHVADLSTLDDRALRSIGEALHRGVELLSLVLGAPSWNLLAVTAPNARAEGMPVSRWRALEAEFHGFLSLMPRLVPLAGFEWASGAYLISTPPEEAADTLRRLWAAGP